MATLEAKQVTLRSKPDVQFKKPITRPHTRQYLKNISNSQKTSDNTTSVKHDQITKDKVLTIGQQHREPTMVAESEDNGLKQEESPMEVADIAQSFSQKLIISAEVDEEERHNPLTCYDYIHDIYRYLKEIEIQYQSDPNYMKRQPHLNLKMRTILIDWLVQVHQRFTLTQETLFLTISYIDRYLTFKEVARDRLQLVGTTAMFLASKYEEIYPPTITDFVFITADSYSIDEIKEMEKDMLKTFNYKLGCPIPIHFLRRFSKIAKVTPEMHTMAKYFLEIIVMDATMLPYRPSLCAASATYLTMKLLDSTSDRSWNGLLVYVSGYTEQELCPMVQKLAKLVLRVPTQKQKAIQEKYSMKQFLKIATHPCLYGDEIKQLAALYI